MKARHVDLDKKLKKLYFTTETPNSGLPEKVIGVYGNIGDFSEAAVWECKTDWKKHFPNDGEACILQHDGTTELLVLIGANDEQAAEDALDEYRKLEKLASLESMDDGVSVDIDCTQGMIVLSNISDLKDIIDFTKKAIDLTSLAQLSSTPLVQSVEDAEEMLLKDLWVESMDTKNKTATERYKARKSYFEQLKRMSLNGDPIDKMTVTWFTKKMPGFTKLKIVGKTIVALNQSGSCEIKNKTKPFFQVDNLVSVIQNNHRMILATTNYVSFLMETAPGSGLICPTFVTPREAMSGAVIFTKFFCGSKAATRDDFVKAGTKEDAYGTTMSHPTSGVFQSLIKMYREVFPQEEDLLKDETFKNLISTIQVRGKLLLNEDQTVEEFHKLGQDKFEDVKDSLMTSIDRVDKAIIQVLKRFLLTPKFTNETFGKKKAEIYRFLNDTKQFGIDFEERDSKLYDFVEGPIRTMVESLATRKTPFEQGAPNLKGSRKFGDPKEVKKDEKIWVYPKESLEQLPKITSTMLEERVKDGWRLTNENYKKVLNSQDAKWKKQVLDGLDLLRTSKVGKQIPKKGEKRNRGDNGAGVAAVKTEEEGSEDES